MTIIYASGAEPLELPDEMSYDPDEEKYYYLSYRPNSWVAGKEYVKDQTMVVPSVSSGFMYKCESSGISGGTEPAFATIEGQVTSDGTVEWKALPYTLLLKDGDTISASVWVGTNGEVVVNDSYVNGVLTEFQLISVPTGATQATITNFVSVLRASGKIEKFNRSIVIPVRKL